MLIELNYILAYLYVNKIYEYLWDIVRAKQNRVPVGDRTVIFQPEFANVRFILSMVTGEPSHEQNMC